MTTKITTEEKLAFLTEKYGREGDSSFTPKSKFNLTLSDVLAAMEKVFDQGNKRAFMEAAEFDILELVDAWKLSHNLLRDQKPKVVDAVFEILNLSK